MNFRHLIVAAVVALPAISHATNLRFAVTDESKAEMQKVAKTIHEVNVIRGTNGCLFSLQEVRGRVVAAKVVDKHRVPVCDKPATEQAPVKQAAKVEKK